MDQDWTAVGDAMRARLDELGMTMTDLAAKSGVSLTTVRELVHVLNTRRRQPRTLVSLSTALGWPREHLGNVLRGRPLSEPLPPDELASVRRELRDLRRRIEALERTVGKAT
ncbi:helix-turn-helix transcriptional regulator [Pseudonocardia sp. RS11V-5]|uniref:helix-turn-helix domain-containing protein n=1 Tax=Pseudonocardia terrae TaxID=2905831 RepID=UPI001E455B5F|nr:helix-turn-helix transcriptional regulator [Pseudonocardia terrae]MCE3551349.1 helix-turn-helix transcriptional regulator [Pseudonocardia terrae]